MEDWQIEINMLLLNDPEDPPTFFPRHWISTSTPDLAFATEDLSRKTSQKVLSPLAGSDHRPVLLAINLQHRPSNPKTFPRWNYKKADWEVFARLTNDRRNLKLLSQAAKFKRLQDHPMRQRLSQPTKGRLKRESFIHRRRILERRQEDILDHDPKEIPPPPPPPPIACRSCLE